MRTTRLVLLGFGNVGRALARLLLEKTADLRERYQILPLVVGIGTGRHGFSLDPAGIDLKRALKRGLSGLSEHPAPTDVSQFLQESGADAVLESIPVDYQAGQPAINYLETALRYGMHAITANKGPVVHAYRSLSDRAAAQGRRFLFESAVLGGAPVFSLWRECLPGARLIGFRGILNSTTNFILSQMEAGSSMEEAIAQAQEIGVAETDPSGDIEGWDAAIKVAALITVMMDRSIQIGEIERTGIEGLTSASVEQARAAGKRWKLVCSASRQVDAVQARVAPEQLDALDPLFSISGTTSALTLQTDVLGELTIFEIDSGPRTTAYGMLADLLNAVG